MIDAFPSDRTDQSFSIFVLPRGTRRCRSVANAHRSKSTDKDLTIGPVPVTNEIAGSLFPAACFRELICNPFCGSWQLRESVRRLSNSVRHHRVLLTALLWTEHPYQVARAAVSYC